jgi:putative ubiquitin-RnfH superfamily antitoxin RatB of RatAB toxin-antitoxin module
LKRCTVVCDTSAGIFACELILADEATIQAAITAARQTLGECGADWERAPTGVYGRIQPRHFVWKEGDRIELYRALQVEPRDRRRERARDRDRR